MGLSTLHALLDFDSGFRYYHITHITHITCHAWFWLGVPILPYYTYYPHYMPCLILTRWTDFTILHILPTLHALLDFDSGFKYYHITHITHITCPAWFWLGEPILPYYTNYPHYMPCLILTRWTDITILHIIPTLHPLLDFDSAYHITHIANITCPA